MGVSISSQWMSAFVFLVCVSIYWFQARSVAFVGQQRSEHLFNDSFAWLAGWPFFFAQARSRSGTDGVQRAMNSETEYVSISRSKAVTGSSIPESDTSEYVIPEVERESTWRYLNNG